MTIDLLIDKIKAMKNPSVIGLDTCLDYLPPEMAGKVRDFKGAAEAALSFNKRVIDAVCDVAPCVKVQAAYYEMYGWPGMRAFSETLAYAKGKGMVTIADVKRNDIGSTAAAYSAAYLGGTLINGETHFAFESDFITVNAYLGIDGVQPFLDDCKKRGKGVFVLCKTSNPGSGQLQDRRCESGMTLYETVGALVSEWGGGLTGGNGYSAVGAVVGATHKEQAAVLRKLMPRTFFLVPGYGAQGGKASDLKVCFDENGGGAAVNSSRAILCAYKGDKYRGLAFDTAARLAAVEMRDDLGGLFK